MYTAAMSDGTIRGWGFNGYLEPLVTPALTNVVSGGLGPRVVSVIVPSPNPQSIVTVCVSNIPGSKNDPLNRVKSFSLIDLSTASPL